MRMTDRIKSEFMLYALTAALAMLLLVPVLRLDKADLSVPLSPGGDETFYQGIIAKPLTTQPWYLENPRLSAPDEFVLYDYPTGTDSALYLIIKSISLLTDDTAVIINVFYLLTYPLAALSMLFAASYLGLKRALAVAIALLFAFAPYHLSRGEGHLLLSAYFMLPIGLVVALHIDQLLGARESTGSTVTPLRWPRIFADKSFIAACVFSVAVALTGVYYAFFYGVVLVIIAARRAVWRRSWTSLVAPAILGTIIVVTVLLSTAPTFVYQSRNGANPSATSRSAGAAEVYALRPIQLIVPTANHRVAALGAISARYQKLLATLNPELDNESRLATLGMLGSIGFALLLAWVVLGLRAREDGPWAGYHLGDLASINITMLLLGAVGGIGFLIAATVTPLIRAYNRVSIVIAMVALLAIGAVLDRATRRYSNARWLPFVVAIVLVGVGILDQTPRVSVRAYEQNKAVNQTQRAFASSAETNLPAGALVFQLPYVEFPGSARALLPRFGEYELLLPYVYSDSLKWSFGAMRGRPTADWQERVSALPVPEMLKAIRAAGFTAVYLDRRGYADDGARRIAEIEAALGRATVVSSDQRMLLWRINK